jgi:hypothetical protein
MASLPSSGQPTADVGDVPGALRVVLWIGWLRRRTGRGRWPGDRDRDRARPARAARSVVVPVTRRSEARVNWVRAPPKAAPLNPIEPNSAHGRLCMCVVPADS